MSYRDLSKRVRFLKTEKGGYEVMSDSMREFAEEMKKYGIEEGMEKGMEIKAQKTARNLFAMHNSVESISEALEVDVEQVEDWLGLARA